MDCLFVFMKQIKAYILSSLLLVALPVSFRSEQRPIIFKYVSAMLWHQLLLAFSTTLTFRERSK